MTQKGLIIGVVVLLLAPVRTHAIGFDPRGAQEAAGLSREFDDATRLQQMQEHAQPLVDTSGMPVPNTRPEAPRSAKEDQGDGSALVKAATPSSNAQATRNLQEAERQIQEAKHGSFWHTVWRFVLWMGAGALMTWGAWTWMVRRAA